MHSTCECVCACIFYRIYDFRHQLGATAYGRDRGAIRFAYCVGACSVYCAARPYNLVVQTSPH